MKVHLIKLRQEHLDQVREWRNSSDVNQYMYNDHEITKSEHIDWFNKIKQDSSKFYWVISVDNILAGVINLSDIDLKNKRCYVGHYIALPAMRGKGLGKIIEYNISSFIFDILKLNKLYYEVLEFNIAAIALHKKCGSIEEGKLRQHIVKNDQYCDVIIMGITKQDWDNIKNTIKYPKIQIEY